MVFEGSPQDWDPPIFEHLLLENPWPAALSLAAIAAVVLWVARRRGERAPIKAALAAGLAMVAIVAAAGWIQTPREAIAAATGALIRSARHPFDEAAMAAVTSDAAQLAVGDYNLPRGPVLEVARRTLQNTPVAAANLTRLDSRQTGPQTGQTRVTLLTQIKDAGAQGGMKTRWLLDWRRDENARWLLIRATLLEINDQPPRDLRFP